ncbi:M23 family metallopeptidase [Arthrobacter sp. H14]|uniref:M23 family metallopeptidase n=1 Tax=Arthrobacter sp. H14 TaxID=1312959 RepID=UPI0004B6793C|nr:M23 family metallopeptidase [Arthrobacter sp. H14]
MEATGDSPGIVSTNSLTAPLASLSVASPFGYRTNPLTGAAAEMHRGIDYAGACSTPVLSAGPGVVVEAGFSPYGGGNRIVVDHGNGLKSTYNHLATIGVSVGQAVARGQQLAGVGTTGASTGCHLHFEVMVNGQVVNPSSFI